MTARGESVQPKHTVNGGMSTAKKILKQKLMGIDGAKYAQTQVIENGEIGKKRK